MWSSAKENRGFDEPSPSSERERVAVHGQTSNSARNENNLAVLRNSHRVCPKRVSFGGENWIDRRKKTADVRIGIEVWWHKSEKVNKLRACTVVVYAMCARSWSASAPCNVSTRDKSSNSIEEKSFARNCEF